jgi:hypothetical protein
MRSSRAATLPSQRRSQRREYVLDALFVVGRDVILRADFAARRPPHGRSSRPDQPSAPIGAGSQEAWKRCGQLRQLFDSYA